MGTHATWVLWVGIRNDELKAGKLTPAGKHVLGALDQNGEYQVYDDLKLEEIPMHGESIGIGVRVLELDWDTELTERNIFPLFDARQATMHSATLERIFSSWGIKGPVRMYHHVDLGG